MLGWRRRRNPRLASTAASANRIQQSSGAPGLIDSQAVFRSIDDTKDVKNVAQYVVVPSGTTALKDDTGVTVLGIRVGILVNPDRIAQIVKNPKWQTVYLDDFIIILVKSDLVDNQTIKSLSIE